MAREAAIAASSALPAFPERIQAIAEHLAIFCRLGPGLREADVRQGT
jgi:hypothetical protein